MHSYSLTKKRTKKKEISKQYNRRANVPLPGIDHAGEITAVTRVMQSSSYELSTPVFGSA